MNDTSMWSHKPGAGHSAEITDTDNPDDSWSMGWSDIYGYDYTTNTIYFVVTRN